jgi:hypothetical protein
LAPEGAASGVEIRHLICGDYRILFRVEARKVPVEHVRHAARLPIADGT